MTSDQAAALQAKWRERVDPLPCDHLYQELESRDGVFLTGKCYCIACGELIVHPNLPQD